MNNVRDKSHVLMQKTTQKPRGHTMVHGVALAPLYTQLPRHCSLVCCSADNLTTSLVNILTTIG